MKIKKPILSRSDDRTTLTKINSCCGDPYEWFDSDSFKEASLHCISFNFFIDWKASSLHKTMWLKRVVEVPFTYNDGEEILKDVIECDGKEYLDNAVMFCQKNGFTLQYVLIPEYSCDSWYDQDNKLIILNVSKDPSGKYKTSLKEYSSFEFIELIRQYKKETHAIGKGKDKSDTSYHHQWSETDLEVFLSEHRIINYKGKKVEYNGDAGFPGDADVLLFDEDGIPRAVIELKKHSDGSFKKYGGIKEQTIETYSNKDKLKYDSLFIISSELNCPFHLIFYPTYNDVVKIESFIQKEKKRLRLHNDDTYPLPQKGEKRSLDELCKTFNELNSKCIKALNG